MITLLLTAGFAKTCTAQSGGLKNLWLANREDIAAAGFTLTSGEYSAVTMESAKVFYKFEFDQDSAELRWSQTMEGNSASVDNQIEFFLSKISTLMRARLQELQDTSPCGMVAITEDNNGVKMVIGYTENHPTNSAEQGRPLKLLTGEATTGKVFTDPNGSVLTMQATNNQVPLVFTGSVPV